MKKSLILVGMLSIGYAYAQEGSVGINTETPKATLEIVPNATNLAGTTNEGIIIPKLTKARVVAIAADKLVEGTKVYVTDEVTAADTQFIGAGKGFYFYNGTKWVKQLTSDTDTNSELWAQRDNAGVTETYLKPADEKNTDQVAYLDNNGVRNWRINFGNVQNTDLAYQNNLGTGLKIEESINGTFLSSDAFPKQRVEKGSDNFFFNSRQGVVRDSHASGIFLPTYYGDETRLVVRNVNTELGNLSGGNSSVDLFSNNKVNNIYGGGMVTSVGSEDGTFKPTVTNNIGGAFLARNFGTTTISLGSDSSTRNYGTTTDLIGVDAYNYNYGTATNIIGGRFRAYTSNNIESLGISNPVQTIQDIQAIRGLVQNRPNSTTAFLRGAFITADFQNQSVAKEGFGIDVRSYVQQGSQVDLLSNVNSYIRANYGANTVKDVYGFRFHHMLNADFKPTNMYGLYLADVNRATNLNYAIYSNAGKVRLGDLKGTGNRIVTVDADGVLSTSDATAIAAQNIYNTDGTLTDNRIVNLDNKRITFDGEGKVRVGSIENENSSAKFGVITELDAKYTRNSLFFAPNLSDGNSVHIALGKTFGRNNNGSIDFVYRGNNSNKNGIALNTDGRTETNPNFILFAQADGNVGINNNNPTERLDVVGNVKAQSFLGANGATIFPDYVFQKYYTGTSSIKSDYSFKTLSQVEDFVKTNGHLPGYKSAETIKAQGYVDLMETQLTNVEKIEELYLHLMEKDKEVQDLKQRLERLEKLIK